MAWAYREFAQDLVRDAIEWLLPLARSSIPRFKVRLRP